MNIKDVEQLARETMNKHGLHGWRLKMIRSLSVAGRCWRSKKLLELSIDYMEVYDHHHVMDTILHEIAHALDTTRYKTVNDKRYAGGERKIQLHHDDVWKSIARSIGCSAMRCVDPKAPRPNRETSSARYKGVCPAGHISYRKRMGKHTMSHTSCAKCNSKTYDERFRFTWYDNGRKVYTPPTQVQTTKVPTPVVRIPKPVRTPVAAVKTTRPMTADEWVETKEGRDLLKSLLS